MLATAAAATKFLLGGGKRDFRSMGVAAVIRLWGEKMREVLGVKDGSLSGLFTSYLGYFCFACDKRSQPRQLIEGRIYLGLSFFKG